MEIRLAKTAGFCFGVNRAVELTYGLLKDGHKVATLGPLIHNPQAVEDMKRKGALVADTVEDIPDGYEVIIRSHGVPRSIYDTLEERKVVYHDATSTTIIHGFQIISMLFLHKPEIRNQYPLFPLDRKSVV